jgi:hypothetical protein
MASLWVGACFVKVIMLKIIKKETAGVNIGGAPAIRCATARASGNGACGYPLRLVLLAADLRKKR